MVVVEVTTMTAILIDYGDDIVDLLLFFVVVNGAVDD